MITYIKNIQIALENELIDNGAILFSGEGIADIHFAPKDNQKADIIVDGKGRLAVPGYIDSHCHGGGGFDCNDSTLEAIEGVTEFYRSHGMTSYYPSLAADEMGRLIAGFDAIRAAMSTNKSGKVEVLGTHLEGPFLNKIYKGSQAEENIIPITEEHIKTLEKYKDVIKRITIAPEVDRNVDLFPNLVEMGMVITGGHTNATYNEAMEATVKGMRGVTHLHNAMSQLKKAVPFSVPGMVEAGLNIDDLYAEIIADGNHVPDQLIQIAYRCKGTDKIFICSDANRATGAADGIIHTCGQIFLIENGVALNSERTSLASSITPINEMVRKLILNVKIPLLDVFKMAATNVAKLMRIDSRKGSIAIGKDADINLLDSDYKVVRTFCKGVQSFERE
ncbi:MAG: N-acetylglucosamine-6-phosphate deacetylase [Prevotellaceae bacterium]|jgi:N-acetylglucosamine-6-phosphate deacetylase|nr:N-acetylglucosamine-6-phosphate deacetylase [Prevotellaceae bacterium]